MGYPNLPSPHNNYFHFALSHLPNARSLIESQMPPAVLRELKLDTLEIVPGSFVASDLRDRHTDLLLSVELANPLKTTKRKAVQRALIYTLLEHKSEPEPLTVLQLLAYLVRIWEKLIRDGLPLCPIIPLVVYHGESRWTVARQMSELIPAPPALAEYQVQFGFPLLDLSQLSDDEIPGEQLLQSALALLKYSRSSQLPKKLQRILQLLGSSLGNQPIEVWIHAIGVYVMAVNKQIGSEELSRIVQSVFPTQIEPGSLADRLLKQGREEGLEKGLEQGLEQGLERGMEQGMEKGMEQGLERGMEQGVEKGLLLGKIQTLQELLSEPITESDALKTRPLEELAKLVQSLQSRLRSRDT